MEKCMFTLLKDSMNTKIKSQVNDSVFVNALKVLLTSSDCDQKLHVGLLQHVRQWVQNPHIVNKEQAHHCCAYSIVNILKGSNSLCNLQLLSLSNNKIK
jgi:hypothetical protein